MRQVTRPDWVGRIAVIFGYAPCAKACFISARICSGVRSFMWVPNHHLWP